MKENIIIGAMVIAVVAGGVGYSVNANSKSNRQAAAAAESMSKQKTESAAMQKDNQDQVLSQQVQSDVMVKDSAAKAPEPAGDAMQSATQ